MNSLCRRIFLSAAFISLLLPAGAGAEEKYICVWRNPERTMRKLFPEARDYRTAVKPISAKNLARIEELAGSPLLPGQREAFQYYEMLDSRGKAIGILVAASQKGEFGAIEFVFGLDWSRSVNGIYIQRARERDKGFREKSFLDSIMGIHASQLGRLDEILASGPTPGRKSVIHGLKKEFASLLVLAGDEKGLGKGGSRPGEENPAPGGH